jgi:hypothetical protein
MGIRVGGILPDRRLADAIRLDQPVAQAGAEELERQGAASFDAQPRLSSVRQNGPGSRGPDMGNSGVVEQPVLVNVSAEDQSEADLGLQPGEPAASLGRDEPVGRGARQLLDPRRSRGPATADRRMTRFFLVLFTSYSRV